ncbi:MAG TPA: hypothetical protein VHC48_08070 [Puia sp.]|nr:hypothetical protein [Puia sp.]
MAITGWPSQANINSDQLWLSPGGEKLEDRRPRPGHILLYNSTPPWVRKDLRQMGYTATYGIGWQVWKKKAIFKTC